jgi:hypothetical protein
MKKMQELKQFDYKGVPKIAGLLSRFNETQKSVVEEIVTKEPSENWSSVAKRIGISERQLRNIRRNPDIQETVYSIFKELFKSEVPEVLKVLTVKAKDGEPWAVKLFLEVSGELNEYKETTSIIFNSSIRSQEYSIWMDQALKEAIEINGGHKSDVSEENREKGKTGEK